MSNHKRQQKIAALKPVPPPNQSNPDDQFLQDLKQLEELQKSTRDLETMQNFMKLQIEVEEQTIRENYWDLVELVTYKGICMTRYVAEQHLYAHGQRPRQPSAQRIPQRHPFRRQMNFRQIRQHYDNGEVDVIITNLSNHPTHRRNNPSEEQIDIDSSSSIGNTSSEFIQGYSSSNIRFTDESRPERSQEQRHEREGNSRPQREQSLRESRRPDQVQERREHSRSMRSQQPRQQRRGHSLQMRRQESIQLISLEPRLDPSQLRREEPRQLRIEETGHAPRQARSARERQQTRQYNLSILRIIFGPLTPFQQAQPELFMRLLRMNQHLMASILHEFNALLNNQQFTRMYAYFLLNQQHQGPMTNVEEILYDPSFNPNAANQVVRDMFRDMDIEQILRNVVRADSQRVGQRLNETENLEKQRRNNYEEKRDNQEQKKEQKKQKKEKGLKKVKIEKEEQKEKKSRRR